MDIFDYELGIHDKSGLEYQVKNDIIITPFLTQEYCEVLVQFFLKNKDYFVKSDSYGNDFRYPNYSLTLSTISSIIFKKYSMHVKDKIVPLVKEVFLWDTNITGLFSPFFNRFSDTQQVSMELHNETSNVSIVVKLNDDFDGGHLTFPRQNFSSEETKVGEALIFPGTVTHPHYVSQLFSGERFTLVGFSHPPAWTFSGIKINDIQ